jgi:hypothetical protein
MGTISAPDIRRRPHQILFGHLAPGDVGMPISESSVEKFFKFQQDQDRDRGAARVEIHAGGDVNNWGKNLLEIFPLSPIDGHDNTTSVSYESGRMEGHTDGLAFPTTEL